LNISELKVPLMNGNSSIDILGNLKEIENAKRIAIIGSGGVGIEHFGAICERYPNKEVFMISSSKIILKRSGSSKFHESVMAFYKDKPNSIFKLDEKVKCIKGDTIVLQNEEIRVDAIISCIGFTPLTDYLKTDLSKVLDESGYIQVNENLQVVGYSNIFALGDINNLKEEKLAQCAGDHASIASQNIENMIIGKELIKYTIKTRPSANSLGNKYCILVNGSGGILLEGYFCSYLKDIGKYKLAYDLK
jgi:apoptosis-inducing factor 2